LAVVSNQFDQSARQEPGLRLWGERPWGERPFEHPIGFVSAEPAPQTPSTSPAPSSAPQAESGTAVAEQPQPAKGTTTTQPNRPDTKQLPPFKVLLHNDNINDMLYVVRALIELTHLDKERALEVMFEAHMAGLSLVLVTHKERAELYQDQFRSKRLAVSIEPA